MTIRSYTTTDAPTVINLWNTCLPADMINEENFYKRVICDINFDLNLFLLAEKAGELLGFAYGARRNDDIREAYLYSLKISVAAMLVIAAATALFAEYITMMFTYGEDSAHLHDGLTEFLRIACLFLPFIALGAVSSSLFLSLGMGVRSLIATLFRNTILIPAAYLAMKQGSLTMIWWATTAGEIIGCVMVGIWCFATLRALMKGRRISRTEPM